MKKELFVNLEKAILARKPKLANALQPGLTEARVTDILNRAKVSENIDAVATLYSWKDGADTTKVQEPFFPESIYGFLTLEAAIQHYANLQGAANALVALGSPIQGIKGAERYFPVFWDGVTGYLAIDLKPGMRNRVMKVEFESDQPFRRVYGSFDEFLADIVGAIQHNEALKCFQGRP